MDRISDRTLTDEELAEMEAKVYGSPSGLCTTDTHRLIAALRASREEVERVQRHGYERAMDLERQYDRVVTERNYLQEEVERLREYVRENHARMDTLRAAFPHLS